MKDRDKIIEIIRDQVSIRSTKSCVQIADEILQALQSGENKELMKEEDEN